MRFRRCLPLLLLVLLLPASGSGAVRAQAASTCADYADQASAQRAADTRDADGDGVYCESNPCPCSHDGTSSAPEQEPAPPPEQEPAPPPAAPKKAACVTPRAVQPLSFSRTKYADIRRHYVDAVAGGAPRILTVNRPGADSRRDRLLAGFPTKPGMDRDEYPPAVGRRTWRASVAYVPSSENRSHGARLGIKLRRFCDGTRVRYVFY